MFGSNTEHTDQSEIDEVAKTADIYTTITDFDKGYETVLGRKRSEFECVAKNKDLGIARALLRKPELLILGRLSVFG